MALISLRQLLDHAAENNHGCPLNVNNLEQMRCHYDGSWWNNSPVIVASIGRRTQIRRLHFYVILFCLPFEEYATDILRLCTKTMELAQRFASVQSNWVFISDDGWLFKEWW